MSEVVMVGGGGSAVLDVVFLHGLDGDARRSWIGKDGASFWLEWLVEDCPGVAVWSVGYEAWSSRWRGQAMPMQDRAINLMASLQNYGIGQRPLCFVTHSMGGLLAKEILLLAAEARSDLAAFAMAARGVVFLGTPHTGAGLTKVIKALGVLYRGTTAVKDLKRNSAHLRQLNDRYRDLVDGSKMGNLVFFEAYPTKGVRVVDAVSANPGLAGVRPIAVDADHIGICKPDSRDTLVYGQIKRFISGIIDTLTTPDLPSASSGGAEESNYNHAGGSPRGGHILEVEAIGKAPVEIISMRADASPHRSAYALGRPLVEVLANPKAALDYEVHPAILPFGAKSLNVLPAYVRRPHDEQLAALIDRAQAGNTVAAALVGESSTGKTRACWEALSRLSNQPQQSDALDSAEWRLWHPLTVQDLLDGLTGASEGAMLAGRTVIWLNELQRYLLSTSEEANRAVAALRALLQDRAPSSGPVLILGTIWQDPYWAKLTGAHTGYGSDPFEQARQLTYQITTIIVPPELTVEARRIAKDAAIDDPRWEIALRDAPERPVQYLAGAEYLRRRYEHATATRRAVLQAAGDARRIGVPAQLSLDFMQIAARDYVPDEAWDRLPPHKKHPAVWVREAIEGDPGTPGDVSLAHGGFGVRGPLHAVRPDNDATHASEFKLADYIDQHLHHERVTIQPRDSLWEAVATLADPRLIRVIGYEARARGRFRLAAYLFKAAATAGYLDAWNDLGRIHQEARDLDGAEEAYRQAIAAGFPAWQGLANVLERRGDREGAEHAAEQDKANGSPRAWAALAWLREESGDLEGANRARTRGLNTFYDEEWWEWKQARQFLRLDAKRRSEKRPEDPAMHAAPSSVDATMEMARLLEQSGDRKAADALAQRAASVGNTKVWASLAWLREESGDLDGAARAYRQVGSLGNYNAWMQVARLHELCGDKTEADRIRRFGITAGGSAETRL